MTDHAHHFGTPPRGRTLARCDHPGCRAVAYLPPPRPLWERAFSARGKALTLLVYGYDCACPIECLEFVVQWRAPAPQKRGPRHGYAPDEIVAVGIRTPRRVHIVAGDRALTQAVAKVFEEGATRGVVD